MSTERTAWHPPFTTLLRERAPHWAVVTGEPQLTQEPLRADDLIELRVGVQRDPRDVGQVLRGLWPLVRVVALLEFKSVSRPFRRGDLARLLAYGLVWFYTRQGPDALTVPSVDGGVDRRRAEPGDLTLALVVPTLSPTLARELAQMRLALTTVDDGYHRAEGAFCAVVVIELQRAAVREHDELMAFFAGREAALSMEAARWVGQNTSQVSTMDKASPALEGYDDWIDRLASGMTPEQLLRLFPLEKRLAGLAPEQRLAGLAPEQRLAGLAPEQRLAGLAPEQRLAGLAPEQRLAGLAPEEIAQALPAEHRVLALPDEALRALSEDYIATLPDDVQAKVRARR